MKNDKREPTHFKSFVVPFSLYYSLFLNLRIEIVATQLNRLNAMGLIGLQGKGPGGNTESPKTR